MDQLPIVQFDISDFESHVLVAHQLLEAFPDDRIFTFSGELGAGKTTFIHALCRLLGTEDEISSPTYSIVNEYQYNSNYGNGKIYHMDLYRIEVMEELLNIGFDDYIFSGDYCLIEWPTIAVSLLPEEALHLEIDQDEEGKRNLVIFRS